MIHPKYKVLFICTGNSARSIMAESLLRNQAGDRFESFSAGSQPRGTVHPKALEILEKAGHNVSELRSKSWNEFEGPGAPELDFIFTVCDSAAKETCPVWPGKPVTAHWGLPDPAVVPEEAWDKAFLETYLQLQTRIRLFLSLPLEALDHLSLSQALRNIGQA